MTAETRQPARGTRIPDAADEQETARRVRLLFERVVPRYDLLNHLLSFQLDRWWRKRTAQRLRETLRRPGALALDLCCGTGDLLRALLAEGASAVVGADFCHPMLVAARRKTARHPSVRLVEADALQLPFPAGLFDAVTSAFGFRNLANYRCGLAEMFRVLRPGGVAAILELSQPRHSLLARLYGFYSRRILPRVGGLVSGCAEAYAYLPQSVRNFLTAEQLASEMAQAGFRPVDFERLTGGIVALHLGWKPA
ncbi:MAG: bifunctional demethylmenaquinone methyltransferase/2-methoxy-6-polyprenyl-1,4-benzoquinol methylase UbiE [Bryobacterales bacterium]|nr:bifunctional demethylmenaquinone methyltransferase/2-methoxy-6-polyprenyl-1,4-benzoquinol methylase UbiE [Bryobacteraceae bacterium]MDW8353905.1 bifunctional demethylmenaquinone methyltransferase/2-methoxy-6-polyprenyl-1,4-benzoquinol methylase UbiE [Bryobacterales bacterium]